MISEFDRLENKGKELLKYLYNHPDWVKVPAGIPEIEEFANSSGVHIKPVGWTIKSFAIGDKTGGRFMFNIDTLKMSDGDWTGEIKTTKFLLYLKYSKVLDKIRQELRNAN